MTAGTSRAKAGLNCQSAFQQTARQCLALVRQHRAAAGRGDPNSIHQIRIALTRLRAARKFFAAMTRDAVWPELKVRIGWLNSALGAARDNDVATAYAKAQGGFLAAKDRKLLAKQTLQAHGHLTSVLRSKRCDQLIASLEHWIEKGPWLTANAARGSKRRRQLLSDYAPARLQRWKRRLASDAANDMTKNRRRHRLRIAAKHYRYMREALTAMGMPESRTALRDRKAAQSAQRFLGDLRDLQRFRKLQPRGLTAKLYQRQKRRLLHKAATALERLG